MLKPNLLIPILFLICCHTAVSQSNGLDTLQAYFDNMPDDSVKAKAMSRMGLRIAGTDPELAMSLGKESIKMGEQKGFRETLAGSYGNIGVAFKILGYVDSTIFYCNKALDIAKAINDSSIMASLYTNLGRVYVEQGRFEEAYESQFAALAIDEARKDSIGMGYSYVGIGISYSIQGKYDKSVKYFKKSAEMRAAMGQTARLANTYNNLGIDYEMLGKYDSSIYFHTKSFELTESKIGNAETYLNVSSVYSKLEENDTSLYLLKKALSLFQEIGAEPSVGTSYLNIGVLHNKMGNFREASKNLERAKPIINKYGYVAEIKILYNTLQEVNERLNRYEKAYQYLSDYKLLMDSVNSKSNSIALEEVEGKYETEKRDKQITELELEKQTAALALAESNNQRNVLIASLAIISIVAILLFIFFRQKRKSLAEKELLLKEIHHRVKNNLQVISSLLNLQADSLGSQDAKEAVMEGQHRVKSMALIHQKLYSADDVRGVDLQDYLENLSSELFRAFGVDQDKINWEVKTSGLKLDIDTVIPLGLIINELITNALKYAFNEVDKGLLLIEMHQQGENLSVMIKDNGKGMDAEAIENSNSFGWKMINSLCRKLKAEIAIQNDQGTQVELMLSRFKLVI